LNLLFAKLSKINILIQNHQKVNQQPWTTEN